MEFAEQDTFLSFGKRLFDIFNNDNIYLYYYLFFISLIIIVLIGRRYYKAIFVYPTILFALLLFNPISIKILNEAGIIPAGRFYRFLWVPPVVIGVAYTITMLVYKIENKRLRRLAFVAFCMLLILCGNPNEAITQYSFTENVYKIPQCIIDMSECIHKDFGEGTPTLYYSDGLVYQFRTYDAAVIAYRDRGETLPIVGDEAAIEMANQGSERQILELVVLQNKKNIVSNETLIHCLSSIDYVICDKQEGNIQFYESVGLRHIGDFSEYEVYRNTNKAKQ